MSPAAPPVDCDDDHARPVAGAVSSTSAGRDSFELRPFSWMHRPACRSPPPKEQHTYRPRPRIVPHHLLAIHLPALLRPSTRQTSLIIIHDEDNDPHSPLYFSNFDDDDSDDASDSDDSDYYIPPDQRPLPPSNVILLLLAPCLRLGALLLPSVVSANLAISIPFFLLAAVLAAFVRASVGALGSLHQKGHRGGHFL